MKRSKEKVTVKWSKKEKDWVSKYPEWENRNARILGNNFFTMIEEFENWDNKKYNFYWSYPERCYDYLISGEYSEVERTWVYDWLKQNKYDGAYIIETKELNLLIFDETKLKILSIETLS